MHPNDALNRKTPLKGGGRMKSFLSIREAAEKWGVSERRINQYCSEGRIPGVQKFGKSWAIPMDAEKPKDPRQTRRQIKSEQAETSAGVLLDHTNLMPLMNTAFLPGHCREAVEAIDAGPRRDIAMAEYQYFSGRPENAAKEAEPYLNSSDMGARLSACLLFAYSNLSIGQIQQARMALGELNASLAAAGEQSPQFRAASAFIASTGAVLLHLPLPDRESNGFVLWGLIAIELFMSFSFLGYIHIEPFSLTFVYLPVLLAGCLLGPGEAALVGMVFGLASMWKASAFYVGAGDAIFSPVMSGKPLESILLGVGTRTLFGLAVGLLYGAVRKGKHPMAGVLAVTSLGRSLHTLFVYGGMGLLFPEMGYTAANTLDEIFRWDFLPIALLSDLIVLGGGAFLQSERVRRILRRAKRREQEGMPESGKKRKIMPVIALVLIACFSIAIYFTDRLGSVLSRYGVHLSEEISYDLMHLQIQFLMGMISFAALVILGIILYQRNQNYLYHEARLDGLTGLLSRRQFFQAGEEALRTAIKNL